MSDCKNVQCKQVHKLLDALLARFGRMCSPHQPSAAKAAILCDEMRRVENERDSTTQLLHDIAQHDGWLRIDQTRELWDRLQAWKRDHPNKGLDK